MTPIPDYDATHKPQAQVKAARSDAQESDKHSMLDTFEQHRAVLDALCRRVGAQRLDAFGSAVRADFDSAASDLDFIVEFEPLAPIRYAEAYFTLKSELEDLFGCRVDLLTESSLDNPFLRRRVDAERRRVYAR